MIYPYARPREGGNISSRYERAPARRGWNGAKFRDGLTAARDDESLSRHDRIDHLCVVVSQFPLRNCLRHRDSVATCATSCYGASVPVLGGVAALENLAVAANQTYPRTRLLVVVIARQDSKCVRQMAVTDILGA
jgi:hypothetical protein